MSIEYIVLIVSGLILALYGTIKGYTSSQVDEGAQTTVDKAVDKHIKAADTKLEEELEDAETAGEDIPDPGNGLADTAQHAIDGIRSRR